MRNNRQRLKWSGKWAWADTEKKIFAGKNHHLFFMEFFSRVVRNEIKAIPTSPFTDKMKNKTQKRKCTRIKMKENIALCVREREKTPQFWHFVSVTIPPAHKIKILSFSPHWKAHFLLSISSFYPFFAETLTIRNLKRPFHRENCW